MVDLLTTARRETTSALCHEICDLDDTSRRLLGEALPALEALGRQTRARLSPPGGGVRGIQDFGEKTRGQDQLPHRPLGCRGRRSRVPFMDALLPFLVATAFFATVAGLFACLAVRIRRRGLGGGAMGAALASYEEAFRVTAHESHIEIRAQAERKAPLLSPDGHWRRNPGAGGAGGAGDPRPRRARARRSRRSPGRWAGRLRRGH
ncbi:hypothetical protein ACFRI7_33825 [Streptomyces sp. NPDC056716]|uniref:hypothetical protein n=1 Tax=unclassified Streptomyces TaxID=2593676 RepID=UPI0036C7755D